MVAVIDYGLGNLGSIVNMLKVIGEKAMITSDRNAIKAADKIILPGVGAFDAGARQLQEKGLTELLQNEARGGKPTLGICLGMQLLGRRSEEGELDGLGLIPFDNVRFCFSAECGLKIPHMGWDVVSIAKDAPLVRGLEGPQRYYFVHSYYAKCDKKENVLMTCEYGGEFTAAVIKDNIYGVQFHPEKSHHFGMCILENFVKRC